MTLPVRIGAGSAAHRVYKAAFAVVVAALLLGAPFVMESFRVGQLTQAVAFAVAVLGLNLLTGFTGQVSLGHAAFIGSGAYTTAILVQQQSWTYLATIPVSFAFCFCLGYIIGIPALRIRGFHLALLTLGLTVLFPGLIKKFGSVTGGANGLKVKLDLIPPSWTGLAETDEHIWVYFHVLLVAAVMFLLAHNLVSGRIGRAWNAVRLHETGAAASGINLAVYKTVSFGFSAALAGVGGSLLVMDTQFVSPDEFSVLLSILILAALLVGGVGTMWGAALGGLFMVFVPWYTAKWAGADATVLRPGVLYGAALIAVTFAAPGGLMRYIPRLRNRLIRIVANTPDRSTTTTNDITVENQPGSEHPHA